MFGIGFPELILILALALIVVGPDKLPDLARSIAKTLVDLRKTAEGLKKSINVEDNPLSEIRPKLEDAAKNFKETILDKETNTWKTHADLSGIDAGTAEDDTALSGGINGDSIPDSSSSTGNHTGPEQAQKEEEPETPPAEKLNSPDQPAEGNK
jgi:sec-independent protein translocase protein TatB